MKTILIVLLSPGWNGIARLPYALKREGFTVITLSRQEEYLNKSLFIDHKYVFTGRISFRDSLLAITKKHDIDLLIPGCDDSINYFCQVIKEKSLYWTALQPLKELIQKSWNNEKAMHLLNSKSDLQKLADDLAILTPRNKSITSKDELLQEIKHRTFPIVLKSSNGYAGDGVKICCDYEDIERKFSELSSTNLVRANFRYKIVRTIGNLMALPYTIKNSKISIQDYISGTPCMHLVFASNGEILSSITLLKVCCYPKETSPSSVVKVINHPKISESCSKIVKETQVSGFLSFDFMVDAKNNAYLLECNPRPTPVAHLTHMLGGNLCTMMKKHFKLDSGQVNPYPKPIYEYLALFPNELKRDAKSEFFSKGYHDIPLEDPELLEHYKNELKELGIDLPVHTITDNTPNHHAPHNIVGL